MAMPATVTKPTVTIFQPTFLASHHMLIFYPGRTFLNLRVPVDSPHRSRLQPVSMRSNPMCTTCACPVPDPASAIVLAHVAGPRRRSPGGDLVHRPAGMARAQCQGEDRALFFRAVGTPVAKARAISAICPVRQPCFDYAAADVNTAGVGTGSSERARRGMRQGRGVA